MSDTAAIRNVLTDPAGLLIVILYSLVTGIIALINPPIINREEAEAIIINDHFLKSKIFSPLIIPGILRISKMISERRKNKKKNKKIQCKPETTNNIQDIGNNRGML